MYSESPTITSESLIARAVLLAPNEPRSVVVPLAYMNAWEMMPSGVETLVSAQPTTCMLALTAVAAVCAPPSVAPGSVIVPAPVSYPTARGRPPDVDDDPTIILL